MELMQIAETYVGLVCFYDILAAKEDTEAQEMIEEVRGRFHNLLMDKLREEGIDFNDREDATEKAFALVGETYVW